MLGQQVTRVFGREGISFDEIGAEGSLTQGFKFAGQSPSELGELLQLCGGEFVINCIGWIPQKASGDSSVDARTAELVNHEFPAALDVLSQRHGVKVLQVGTDCVFAGTQGRYTETSAKDATDLYGASKILGESAQVNAMVIRSSIIGPDMRSSAGLFSWYMSQPLSSHVVGFENHLWNGVTTLALARLFAGIIRLDAFDAGVRHWVPEGVVSKYELLKQFHSKVPNTAPVERGLATYNSDRTLATDFKDTNRHLWSLAGYSQVPYVADLVDELILDFEEHWQHA